MFFLTEGATTAVSGMTTEQVTAITTALTEYGSTMLDYFIQLLPAIVLLSAIGFVIALIRKKARV